MGLGDKSKDIEDSSAGGHGITYEERAKSNTVAHSHEGLCSTFFFVTLLGSQLEGH